MSLALRGVGKTYPAGSGRRTVLRDVTVTIARGEKCGLLGRNGCGKSTLLRIMGGAEQQTSGSVRHDMSVSWPLAFGGAFQGGLSGLDNAKFIARTYRRDVLQVVDYVAAFAELGASFREPVVTYSSGMRARLAFGLSLAVDFDCLLIDEIVAVGDRRFREKCQRELFEQRADRAWVMISHDVGYIRDHCGRGFVIDGGRLSEQPSVEAAIAAYEMLP